MTILDGDKLEDGLALALSGGGYRAALFHVGALLRLNELGLLPSLKRISSVSGGSITAGVLAKNWNALQFDSGGCATNFEAVVVEPILNVTANTLDVPAALAGMLPGVSPADALASQYDRHLFLGATLQDIPDEPRFTFCALNLLSGGLWRFAKPYMADYRVGQIRNPKLNLSSVVAASGAFPIGLSPLKLRFSPDEVEPMGGADLHRPPFTRRAMLTDGGVYENLGLEPIWKRYRALLVSDAGGVLPTFSWPFAVPLSHSIRVAQVAHAQHGNLRARTLIDLFASGRRTGAYWGMTPYFRKFTAPNSVEVSENEALVADRFRVRLNHTTAEEQRILMRAGYSRSDAAIRTFFAQDLPCPTQRSWWTKSMAA